VGNSIFPEMGISAFRYLGNTTFHLQKWHISNGTLEIHYSHAGVQTEGRLVNSSGSCATEFELVETIPRLQEIESSSREMKFVDFEILEDSEWNRKYFIVGSEKFWKHRDTPNEY
jgi:hypothetical protein